MKFLMSAEEADTWPLIWLLICSGIFAFVALPALIAGFQDEKHFGLFVMTAIVVVPMMISVWVCAFFAWKERRN